MTRLRYVNAAVAVLAIAVVTQAWAQRIEPIESGLTTIAGVVRAIDHTSRVLTISKSDGTFVSIDAPAKAERFDEVNIGDRIRVTYYDVISARVKPADEPAVDTSSSALTPSVGGGLGGTSANQRTMTVTIVALDRENRAVTFTGPGNFRRSRWVRDSTNLEEFNVGDRIDVTWTTAVVIAVNP